MAEGKNLSMMSGEENRKKRLQESAKVLRKWFTKWLDTFPSHAVTEVQQLTYLEALDDLSPEQIEVGCREATRTAEVLPKPGHIRAALSKAKANGTQMLGPELEWTDAESADFRARWLRDQKSPAPPESAQEPQPRFQTKNSGLSIEEQRRVLREKGFLN